LILLSFIAHPGLGKQFFNEAGEPLQALPAPFHQNIFLSVEKKSAKKEFQSSNSEWLMNTLRM
jgi:hypothetical protein